MRHFNNDLLQKVKIYIMKEKEDLISLLLLIILILAFSSLYILYLCPPQLGWWNYYAQEIVKGSKLYSDIYCFLPPGFPWLMSFLYLFFKNNLFYYQLFGIFLRCIESILIYKTLRMKTAPIISFFATFISLVLTASYSVDMPLDTNQIVRFIGVLIAFLCIKAFSNNTEKARIKYLFIVGFLTGVSLLFKQTFLPFLFCVYIGILFVFYFFVDKKSSFRYSCYYLLGCIIPCFLSLMYFIISGTLSEFLSSITSSVSVKGGIQFSIMKVLNDQLNLKELLISCLIAFMIFNSETSKRNVRIKYCVTFLLLILLVSRMNDFSISYRGYSFGIKTLFLLFGLLSVIVVSITILMNKFMHYEYQIKEYCFKFKKLATTIAFICLLIFILMVRMNTTFIHNVISNLWSTNLFTTFTMTFINILFYISIIIIIHGFIFLIKKKINIIDLSILIFLSVCSLLPIIGFTSAILQELYIFPIAAVVLMYILNNKEILLKVSVISICFLIVGFTIYRKGISPYSWHGWTISGYESSVDFKKTDIDGLNGFLIPEEDEEAYNKIIQIIKDNSKENDYIYQFPNMPLFNVLTNRSMGTYAAVHYWDVTPDIIAIQDAEYLYNNHPKIVIWCDLGESAWQFHESYFRGGNTSGQRNILNFYNSVIQKEYILKFEYKTLSVWVRE